MHRFDLLILTHNRLETVQRCFESLRPTLERDDVRCFVLDNASTDGTADWLWTTLQPNVHVILCKENLGVGGGRAELLKYATAERIVFLDSDVLIVDQRWLDDLDRVLDQENIGLVGPGGSMVRPDWSNFMAAVPGHECDCVAGYCQMIKAEVLRAGIAFDPAYGKFWTEDSDACMQIREAGYDIWTVPVGVVHTPGHSGDAANDEQLQRNLAIFRDKWRGKGLTKVEGAY